MPLILSQLTTFQHCILLSEQPELQQLQPFDCPPQASWSLFEQAPQKEAVLAAWLGLIVI